MQNPAESSHDGPGRTGRLNGLPSDGALLAGANDVRIERIVGREPQNGARLPRLWQEEQHLAADRAAAHRHVSEQLVMVSHELRNCLGAVRIAASLIKLKRRQPAAAENARLVIEHQAAQMAALINDLLEVALPEPSEGAGGWPLLRRLRVDLRVVARHALETVAGEIGRRNQRLTVTLPEAPVWLQADAGRLEQVLVNLLVNASKYTDDAGELRLSVQHTTGEATVRVCRFRRWYRPRCPAACVRPVRAGAYLVAPRRTGDRHRADRGPRSDRNARWPRDCGERRPGTRKRVHGTSAARPGLNTDPGCSLRGWNTSGWAIRTVRLNAGRHARGRAAARPCRGSCGSA